MATTKKVAVIKNTKKETKPAKKTETPKKDIKQVKKEEVKEVKKADGKDGNKKIYHVSKRDNDGREWKVFIQGSDKNIKITKTQSEALDYAKSLAKKDGNATIMLHGLDGKIRKF